MTLRTGNGNGAYLYYYCRSSHRGRKVCSEPKIPEKILDDAVLTGVRSRVLSTSLENDPLFRRNLKKLRNCRRFFLLRQFHPAARARLRLRRGQSRAACFVLKAENRVRL
jgi:hypothetical protein